MKKKLGTCSCRAKNRAEISGERAEIPGIRAEIAGNGSAKFLA